MPMSGPSCVTGMSPGLTLYGQPVSNAPLEAHGTQGIPAQTGCPHHEHSSQNLSKKIDQNKTPRPNANTMSKLAEKSNKASYRNDGFDSAGRVMAETILETYDTDRAKFNKERAKYYDGAVDSTKKRRLTHRRGTVTKVNKANKTLDVKFKDGVKEGIPAHQIKPKKNHTNPDPSLKFRVGDGVEVKQQEPRGPYVSLISYEEGLRHERRMTEAFIYEAIKKAPIPEKWAYLCKSQFKAFKAQPYLQARNPDADIKEFNIRERAADYLRQKLIA